MIRFAAVVAALVMAAAPVSAAGTAGVDMTIPAKERAVHVIYFKAPGDAPRPAALILHGAGGFGRYLPAFEHYAAALTAAGMDTYLVDYYSRADAQAADSVFEARYEAWARLVGDIADHVLAEPQSNGKVGLVGFSNGGILATGAGALDPKITAAVIYYGTEPWPLKKPPTRFPPLLILHGDADAIIPVDQGRRLAQVAKHLGGEAELVVYPGAKHGFGIIGNDEVGADSLARTLGFLKKQLGTP